MKTLFLVFACATGCLADQGADAFVTGFANSLNRALQAKQGQQQEAAQERPAYQTYKEPGHYDARTNYGDLGGYTFISFRQCMRYISSFPRYVECVWVE